MNAKPVLLAVAADEHYKKSVARAAIRKNLVSEAVFVGADQAEFSAALARLNKDNLIIAKGMAETADFLRLILNHNGKELLAPQPGGKYFLSHCAVLVRGGLFRRARPLILTDAAAHIAPSAEDKVRIVENAIGFARSIGIARPAVSILTPAGKPNPKIKSSVDGDFVIKALGAGNDIRLDQLDAALSARARRAKGLGGGIADIILASDLDSGNDIWKFAAQRAGYSVAGLICGARVPIVLNSRSDAPKSKLLSIRYAAGLMRRQS